MDLEHNENEELEVTPAEPEAAPEAEPETAPVPEAEPEEKPEEKPAEKKPGMSKGAKIAIFLGGAGSCGGHRGLRPAHHGPQGSPGRDGGPADGGD